MDAIEHALDDFGRAIIDRDNLLLFSPGPDQRYGRSRHGSRQGSSLRSIEEQDAPEVA